MSPNLSEKSILDSTLEHLLKSKLYYSQLLEQSPSSSIIRQLLDDVKCDIEAVKILQRKLVEYQKQRSEKC